MLYMLLRNVFEEVKKVTADMFTKDQSLLNTNTNDNETGILSDILWNIIINVNVISALSEPMFMCGTIPNLVHVN